MRQQSRKLSTSSTFIICALYLAGFGGGTALAEKVTIVTISTTGEPVLANVWYRFQGGEWLPVPGQPVVSGKLETNVETCDYNTEYKAAPLWSTHTRNVDQTATCTEPEVVFNDFVPTGIAYVVDVARLASPDNWVAAFGGSELATLDGKKLANEFQTAFAKGEYGRVAIAGSEIAAQLRAAGKINDATIFATLSVDATARGVIEALGGDEGPLIVLNYDEPTGTAVLSTDAKALIENYQMESLGYSATAMTLGKADWTTMRSLSGGASSVAIDWKLPNDFLKQFDATQFSAEKLM